MKIFTRLYDMTLRWSAHRHAGYYLGGLSFAESSFFPIPPDVMLAPMSLAKPNRAWRYAMIATVASVLGGVFGYLLGYFAFDLIKPWMEWMNYMARFERVQDWFEQWGFWVIFIAGFSPIPYKVFTVAAGVISLSLPVFILASLFGRGLRFFIVAGLIHWGGARLEKRVRQYVEWLGWLCVVAIVIIFLMWR